MEIIVKGELTIRGGNLGCTGNMPLVIIADRINIEGGRIHMDKAQHGTKDYPGNGRACCYGHGRG